MREKFSPLDNIIKVSPNHHDNAGKKITKHEKSFYLANLKRGRQERKKKKKWKPLENASTSRASS